ncbi:MAG: HAMP domain-containing sensor histidine kinase [Propionicimonas sp.]
MPRPSKPGLAGLGLVPRLLLNNLLVILAGSGTVLVSALLIAPAVFHQHLMSLDAAPDPQVLEHVARGFDQAVLLALGGGILIAAVTASAISWLVARRLAAPVEDAAHAASRLADGKLDARVVDPRMGPEFATLASAINELAARLESTEVTRRELTADLAHQLRTPIASIGATVEAVREGVLPADDATLETLSEQSARLARLVADLEVVSRAEERQLILSPEPVAVAVLVDAAIAAHSGRYRAASVRLLRSVEPATPPVLVDPDRIAEALGNLLDNALSHTPVGGAVTVTARRGDSPATPAIIEVRDTGTGFPAARAETIFRRFNKTPGSPGTGLGLTIARAIIQAHHGTLTAHSDGPGEGAVFTMVLPGAPPGS